MTSYPQLELDAQLCFPLYATTRAVTRHYATLLEGTGLTYPQYLVLLVLWESEAAMSVGELGERLRLDSGTLTPLLKRLESVGLVARERDPDDERRVLVSVTPVGWEMRDRVADVPFRLQKAMALPQDDALALRDQLSELLAHLDAAARE